MQEPQILGISIGVSLIVIGWVLRHLLIKKDKRISGGIAFSIFAYIGVMSIFQNILFSYAPTWTWEGVFMVWAEFFGSALAPIIFAFLGLIYKPNRVAGFVVMLITLTALMMLGNT